MRIMQTERRTCFHPQESNSSGSIAGPSWIQNPRTEEERDQMRHDQCYAEALQEAESVCGYRPNALALFDSWAEQSGNIFKDKLSDNRISILKIPPHTTGYLQPLDVGFFRQYKIIYNRMMDAARMDHQSEPLTKRWGIINFNSLVFNQLQAPIFRDLFRWAWRHTDN